MYMSTLLLYSALAIHILCFYPPDIFIPLSPISVISPPGNISISLYSSHKSIMFMYFYSSYYSPKRILSLIVLFLNHAYYDTYTALPLMFILPSTKHVSFKMHDNNVLFPDPTSPTIPTSLPLSKLRLKFLKQKFSILLV